MDVKTKKAPMVAALLAVLWAFGAPAAAEASLPLDARASRVFKTADPFATAPQLDLPSLTEQLRAVEERRATASGCVALCELAAGIEAHPFGAASAEPLNRSEDAWGNYRFTSELAPSHNRFGYTGHYWDKEASLYYAKARYYDPFTARFTQSDSFLGNIDDPPSLHRYFYGHANPTRFVDPTGHAADEPGYWSTFAYHFSKDLSEAPSRVYDRFVGILTPGDEGNGGHTAEAQRRLLKVAGNEELDPVSRTLATMEAVKLQGAVVVEETIIRPAQEAPASARRAGVYANDALTARDGTAMAVGVLGVIASSSEAFGGLLPVAPGRSIGRKAISSVETQLIREGEQSVARAGATGGGGTTVTPWGTRSNATGKFGEGPRGGLDPVDDFIEHAKANGYEVLGKEISFKTPFETRHVDVVIRNPLTGKIGGVEIKSSAEEFAKLKPEQFAADRWINRFGAKAVGKNAKAAGVTSIDHTVKIQWPPPPQ